jgi:hypothetical protein
MYQHMQTEEDASASGGIAYVDTNGLAASAAHIVSSDSSYYTLTYSPNDLRRDNKWHQVKIKLENPQYQLSYRRGYFDDDLNDPPAGHRTVLTASGERAAVPKDAGQPIIFQAHALPAPPVPPASGSPNALSSGPSTTPLKRGETRYLVHYLLPVNALQPSSIQDDMGSDSFKAEIDAFDHFGNYIAGRLVTVSFQVDQKLLRSEPDLRFPFDQTINLPPGEG